MISGSRSDIDDPVAGQHGFFIVLDDNQRVSQIAHIFQGMNQLGVVSLVQTDRRLVQNIQNAGKLRADLCSQPDTLCFTAGQRSRQTIQGQIFQTDVL